MSTSGLVRVKSGKDKRPNTNFIVHGRLGASRNFKDCGMPVDYEGRRQIKQSGGTDEGHSYNCFGYWPRSYYRSRS